jgi:glycosyltransferase involved in cell wall biosynthesis
VEVRTDVSDLERDGVRVIQVAGSSRASRIAAIPKIARLARNYDLVHCTEWDASLWGRMAAVLARRPSVVTEHTLDRGIQMSEAGAARGRAIALHHRLLGPSTYAVVHVAEQQARVLLDEDVPPAKLVHIPNGVPLDHIREVAASGLTRSDIGVPEDAKVVAHVARFYAMKRQAWTLEAVRRLREELGRAHARLLAQLPHGRLVRGLAGVDAALRHLPGVAVGDRIGAGLGAPAADEDEAVPVEKGDPDAGAVGQLADRAGRPAPRHHRASEE